MTIRSTRIFLCIVFVTGLFTGIAGAANEVEFRPILSENELKGRQFDKLQDGAETFYVWRLHYLSDRDIKKVEAYRSATRHSTLMVGFIFNEDGRKRFYRFTKKFAKRRVAILVEGKLLTTPVVWIPYFMGDKVVVNWPGPEKALLSFAAKINNAQPSIAVLYIEETGRYNDVAADEWAKVYESVNRYCEEKNREFGLKLSRTQTEGD